MEARPKDKMPPNPLYPIVRAVVVNAIHDWQEEPITRPTRLACHIADRLCETIDQDGWDYSDRVRRASTKHTWGLVDDAPEIHGDEA